MSRKEPAKKKKKHKHRPQKRSVESKSERLAEYLLENCLNARSKQLQDSELTRIPSTVEQLDLASNFLRNLQNLKLNSRCTDIDLSNNPLDERGVEKIIVEIQALDQLKRLRIDDITTTEGNQGIVCVLKHLPARIEFLSLSNVAWNCQSDKEKVLKEALLKLRTCTELRKLILKGSTMLKESTQVVCTKVLPELQHLEHLNLSSHCITRKAADALMDSKLKLLNLSCCDMSESFDTLCVGLKRNTTLEKLVLLGARTRPFYDDTTALGLLVQALGVVKPSGLVLDLRGCSALQAFQDDLRKLFAAPAWSVLLVGKMSGPAFNSAILNALLEHCVSLETESESAPGPGPGPAVQRGNKRAIKLDEIIPTEAQLEQLQKHLEAMLI